MWWILNSRHTDPFSKLSESILAAKNLILSGCVNRAVNKQQIFRTTNFELHGLTIIQLWFRTLLVEFSEYSNIIYLGMNIFWRRLSKPRRQISDLRRPCDRNVVTPSVLLGGKPSSGSSRKSKSWRIQTRVIRIKNVHNSGQNKGVFLYLVSRSQSRGEQRLVSQSAN